MQVPGTKTIKHIWLLTIILTLMICLVAATAAWAVHITPALSVADVNGQPGSTVQVPVNLTSSGQVGGIQFDLSYDSTLLSYQDIDAVGMPAGFSAVVSHPSAGKVRVLVYSSGGLAAPAGITRAATMVFNVSGPAVPGQSCQLELSRVVLSDTDGNSIDPFNLFNGQFTVSLLGLSAPVVEGLPGSTVQVPVDLSSQGQVAALQFDLDFCSDKLTYLGAVQGDLTGAFSVETNQVAPGKVRVVIFRAGGGTIPVGTGSVAVLTFNVAGTAIPGQTCPLELSAASASGSGGGSIQPVELTDGLFIVPSSLDLSVPDVEGVPGLTVQVPVELASQGQVAALQFDLDFCSDKLDYQDVAQGSLTGAFSVEANQVAPGKVRVVIFRPGGGVIIGGTGSVAVLTFNVAGTAIPGQTCPLELSAASASGSGGGSLAPVWLTSGTFTVAGPLLALAVPDVEALPGQAVQVPVDLTSQGQVAALQFDLDFCSNKLAYLGAVQGDLTGAFSVEANQVAPGKVRVVIYRAGGGTIPSGTGSVAVISFMVDSSAAPGDSCPLPLSNAAASGDGGGSLNPIDLDDGLFTVARSLLVLTAPQVEGQPGSRVEAPVSLTSQGQVSAVQFDLIFCPDILTYQGSAVGSLPAGYAVDADIIAPGLVRVIVFNPGSGAIPAGTVPLAVLSFDIAGAALPGQTCPLDLSGAILADTLGGSILSYSLEDGLLTVKGLITLAVSPDSTTIAVGRHRHLAVTVDPADASVAFSSDDAAVAAVDGSGTVQGVAEGNTTVRVAATKPDYIGDQNEVAVKVLYVLFGDVNKDGSIDVLDVVRAIDIALGSVPSEYEFLAADVNDDGFIDVVDVVLIIDLALAF